MTGEHPEIQNQNTHPSAPEIPTVSEKRKLPRGVRTVAAFAAGVATLLGVQHITGSESEMPLKAQPAATAEAEPHSMPKSKAKSTSATSAAPTVKSSEAQPNLNQTVERTPGFSSLTQVKPGDKLHKFNGIAVLDTVDNEGDRRHVAIYQPLMRQNNGALEIGMQPFQRKENNGQGVRDGASAITWATTSPTGNANGLIEGGAVYYAGSTSPSHLITKVTVLGTGELSATQTEASNYRTAILASDVPGAQKPANMPTINGGFNYITAAQLPNAVVGLRLNDVVGNTQPWEAGANATLYGNQLQVTDPLLTIPG